MLIDKPENATAVGYSIFLLANASLCSEVSEPEQRTVNNMKMNNRHFMSIAFKMAGLVIS